VRLDCRVFLEEKLKARAHARWVAERTGLPWPLPTELEWEKVAHGTDGRRFPWGDHFDPAFTCARESHATRPLPVDVTAFPADVSPYGVRGLGGNVRDWCLDAWSADGPALERARPVPPAPSDDADTRRVYRGGYWHAAETGCLATARYSAVPTARASAVGVRLVRSL
jgi:Uncharacterized conserved protein